MTDSNIGHRDRLRDRFFTVGLDGFKPHEVLELILFTVYPRVDTKELAKKVLNYFENDIHKVFIADKEDFKGLNLSDQAIALIKLIREVNIYIQKLELINQRKIVSSEDAYEFLKSYYKGLQKEEFFVIYLNNKNKVLAVESEFKGTINEAKIYVREIVKQCLKYNAASIIISHNHPSGSIEPSTTYINITLKIKKALEFLDINLIDHIIVGDNKFYSFIEWNVI